MRDAWSFINILAKGDALPSLTSQLLQEGVTPEEEEILKWVSFNMYVGGTDTTSYTIAGFFLAMTIYPEVLKKAQAEVDVVVGDKRLPTMKDRGALPYVNALCKELLRWNVLIPMPPHAAAEDIVYEGCLVPEGTCLLGNIWNQQLDPREMCFGWGRRSCPGSLLAESAIFICVVMALATLGISRCIENGVEVVPTYDVKKTMIRRSSVGLYQCDGSTPS
ncbi:cytochrome P450 [Boletus coccyginus]|nr:cytochrome P450 [Boletus coccyginus]